MSQTLSWVNSSQDQENSHIIWDLMAHSGSKWRKHGPQAEMGTSE